MLGGAAVALVVAAVTSSALPGGGTAQAANEPAEVVSRLRWRRPVDGVQQRRLDLGRRPLVVFNSSPPAPVNDRVSIRDRIADTTVDVPIAPSQNGTISDDAAA